MKNYFPDHSLVFVDFAGFGESCEPNKPFFVADYVIELFDLISKFDVQDLVLVGHSFGGRVAIKFACYFQHEFNKFKLCLVDSAGMKPKRGFLYYLKVKKFKRLKRKAQRNSKLQPKLLKYGSSDYKKLSPLMKQTFVNVVNENLELNAKYIKAQTLIVWGEKDKETKLFMARRLKKLIKNSKLEIIKNAGHFSYLDSPQEFLILLDTFIKN